MEKPSAVVDNDSVILFNYRGDRALELTKAFEADELHEFDPVKNLRWCMPA